MSPNPADFPELPQVAMGEFDELDETARGLAEQAARPQLASRLVDYVLTAQDAEAVNRRRVARPGAPDWPPGAQAHVGNPAGEGDILPMLIVHRWSGDCVNGQVFLDGNDVLWVTSVTRGDGPGHWD